MYGRSHTALHLMCIRSEPNDPAANHSRSLLIVTNTHLGFLLSLRTEKGLQLWMRVTDRV
nr:hypothetical protein [Turnip yellows virus associated RNA]